MLFNVKKLNQLLDFKNFNFFDENFFLYLENDDLCERLTTNKEDIYVVPSSKIKHIGSSAVDKKYSFQIELSRNWHWIWSKFYFNKKYKGYSIAFFNGLPSFFSAVVKFLFFKISKNEKKSLIYQHRYMGFISAVLGKKSYYRPKLDI